MAKQYPAIRIEKSTDDIPKYSVYRITQGVSVRELTLLLYQTQDFQRVMRTIIEWK